ncbi:polymorphic toxin-type HINT domain-containing protein [Streptomyces sp. NPDC047097]|uniref:polymorphic toxin-type HINT domain-containing protein n=1 Tax=Streptomyces sp. NPDC047097 TaxID=3155260 RepID=UPI0033DE3578
MSLRQSRRRPAARRITLTLLLTTALSVPALPAPPVSVAVAAERPGRPDVPGLQPTRVHPVTSPQATAARAKVAKEKAVNRRLVESARAERQAAAWPKASSRTVDVTAAPEGGALVRVRAAKRAASSRQSRPVAGGTADIRVLDQKTARRAGVTGVLFTVAADRPGPADITVDYSSFASAIGGNWSTRLGLVTLPACALTTPQAARCRTTTPQVSDNDVHAQKVTTRTGVSGSSAAPTVVAVMAAPGGSSGAGAGDFKATPLAASAAWEAGSSSGGFSWSYPLTTPPAAAGPQPSLALSYDSGSIDGRTANTNNQGSQVGEGFDLTSSYIERKYGACEDDGQNDSFDLCWKYDNASLVLNGKASELVKDDKTGVWHLKGDDASKVTRSTGAANGDADGEHWKLVTGDGTTYSFGLNKLPGAGDERTDSVWTVPVYGDDKDEPGYDGGSAFTDRHEKQAWRWNLDLVQDVHGNASTYWYKAETNHYAQNGAKADPKPYTRGGYLEEIRYGQRADTLFTASASNKVTFSYAERCFADNCSGLTADTADDWPDVPFDSICSAGTNDCEATGPSFFTRKRLTGVNTFHWSRTAPESYQPVDSYALGQKFFDGQDIGNTSDQVLTLTSVSRTGRNGGEVTVPPIEFTYQQRPNRVDASGDDILPLTRPRMASLISETGAITSVTFSTPECVRGTAMPAAEDDNNRSCYPVYWPVNGGDPKLDWFHKYRVTSVTTNDPGAGNPGTQVTYEYSGPGWHYDDDPFTKEKHRTWSAWRGYQKVTSYTGDEGATRTKSVKLFMQGMHGDKRKDGTTRSAVVRGIDLDNASGTATDDLDVPDLQDGDQLAGRLRQEIGYDGATATSAVVNEFWSKETASQQRSYANSRAYFVKPSRIHSHTYLTTARTWRTTAISHTYDPAYASTTTTEDHGVWSASGDETCTRNWYARNQEKGLTGLVSRTRTVAKPCATGEGSLNLPANALTRGDVLADIATVYDNPSATGWSPGQVPTLGLSTWSGRPKSYPAASGTADRDPSAATGWQTVGTTVYDTDTAKLGRSLKATDAKGRTTTTAYYPAAAGPLTTKVVTAPRLSSNNQAHQTTTTYDPARGTERTVLDANAKRTEHTYDALGRITATWLPPRSKSAGDNPDARFGYGMERDKAPWSSVATLKADGTSYDTTYSLFDSQLRPIQTQSASPQGGRILTDTRYNSRGLAYETYKDVWDDQKAPEGVYQRVPYGGATQTLTEFDGAARPITSTLLVDGVTKWSTRTTYTGDSTATTAPTGGTASRTITDALGRTTETRTYAGTQPDDTEYGAATGKAYTRVRYTHTRDGQQSSVTGPDGAVWTYEYDLYGRLVKTGDPDKGTGLTTYDELDQVDTTKDAHGRLLLLGYDELGRKTGLWKSTRTDASKLAAWTYDSVSKGLPTASIRYENGLTGKAYTKQVTGYDELGRPTGSSLTLPATDPLVTSGAVAATTAFATTYRQDGTVNTAKEPAAAGLPAETLTHRYTATGLPTELSGTSGYLLGATYTALGQVGQLQLGPSSAAGTKRVFLTQTYEKGTGRLTQAAVDDQTRGPVQDLAYSYDQAGNVTAIADSANIGTGSDNQCFTYDAYRRLSEAWTPKTADCATSGRTAANLGGPAPYWTGYTYTASGQRKTEKQNTGTPVTRTYCYDTARPHALTATTTTGNCTGGAAQYRYDATGNTVKRVKQAGASATQTLDWNEEGGLARLADDAAATATNYLYDADGQLLIRRDNATDGETVLYLGATEVHLKTGKKWANRYYSAAGATIALRSNESGTEKLSFLAADHHATSSVAVSGDATQSLSKRYTTPFGASRGTPSGTWPDDKGFLGKPTDTRTGLTHVEAREYDPSTGQFISVDPVLQLELDQTLNGYSYGMQNPATFADPDGRRLACGQGFDVPCPSNDSNGDGVINHSPTRPAAVFHPRPSKPVTWREEGWAAADIDGDGVIQILPGVHIKPGWHGTSEFIDAFYARIKETVGYGSDELRVEFAANHRDEVSVQIPVNKALVNACQVTGCPSKKRYIYNFFAVAVVGGALQQGVGGRGRVGGRKSTNCGNCFLAGTDVLMGDGTTKDIEDIKVGDKVLATDPETGQVAPRKVTRLIRTEDDKHFNELSIATPDGVEQLTATHEHPFWSPSHRRWIEASDLKPGDTLRTDEDATVIVTGNRPFTKHARTYNFTVNGLHTYYVLAGQTALLVHNSNGWCGPGLRTASEAGFSPTDSKRIQNAADKAGQPIIVVGSRANGTPNPTSDWDYILSGPSRTRHSVKNSLPRGTGDGEGSGRGRDFWQSYNPNRPDYAELDRDKPYVVFEPRSR